MENRCLWRKDQVRPVPIYEMPRFISETSGQELCVVCALWVVVGGWSIPTNWLPRISSRVRVRCRTGGSRGIISDNTARGMERINSLDETPFYIGAVSPLFSLAMYPSRHISAHSTRGLTANPPPLFPLFPIWRLQ